MIPTGVSVTGSVPFCECCPSFQIMYTIGMNLSNKDQMKESAKIKGMAANLSVVPWAMQKPFLQVYSFSRSCSKLAANS